MRLLNKHELENVLIKEFQHGEYELEEFNEVWERAKELSIVAFSKMTGIGFMSNLKRYNTFLATCSVLDEELGLKFGESDKNVKTIHTVCYTLILMRSSSKQFRKAFQTFCFYIPRMGAKERAELPVAAHIFQNVAYQRY